jgi:hypothetical protein
MGFDAWSLSIEASAVIGLRLLKFGVGGPAATAEARQMVNEKFESGFDLHSMALSGRLDTTTTLEHYLLKVRANRCRLAAES